VLQIVRELGQRVGVHVWCHVLRHTSITTAIVGGQKAGVGLDRSVTSRGIGRWRRCWSTATSTTRRRTQRTLADVVASTLTTP
jgi:hypothetical protein